MSETERLIYGCCGAAGLFLSHLHCAAAYLRPCLQLMDEWSQPSTALRWEGEEGGERGWRQGDGPPSGWTQACRPETRRPTKNTTGIWNASWRHASLLQAAESDDEPVCRASFVYCGQRLNVNSVFYHRYGSVLAMLFRPVFNESMQDGRVLEFPVTFCVIASRRKQRISFQLKRMSMDFYWVIIKMGLLVCNVKVCRGWEVFKGF